MKRVGNLWDGLVSFPNLLGAARKARKGKRSRFDVQAFEFDAERAGLASPAPTRPPHHPADLTAEGISPSGTSNSS